MTGRSDTEIRFFNLAQSAYNRLGSRLPILELPIGFFIRLTKDVERLSIVNKFSTEAALGFSVPFTLVNNAIFVEYTSTRTLDNRRQYYDVSVKVQGHPLPFTRLVVKGRNEPGQVWELELRRSADDWVELASQLKINQIDYGIFSPSYLSIEGNWDMPAWEEGGNTTYWPPMDYGGWADLAEPPQESEQRVKFIGLPDLRPLISLPYLLKQGMCQIGYTMDGVIFDTEWFRRLWVYVLKPTYYDVDTRGGRIRGRTFERQQVWDNGNDLRKIIRYTEQIKGVFSEVLPANLGLETAWATGIKNGSAQALRYRFIFKGTLTNDRPLPFSPTFTVMEFEPEGTASSFGEVLNDPFDSVTVELAPGESKQVSIEIEAVLKAGQKGVLAFPDLPNAEPDFFIEKGMYFEVLPLVNGITVQCNVFNVADAVSGETSLLDWIKATVQLMDGRVDTDRETRTVGLFPNNKADVYGETVPGYLLDEEPAIPIDHLIVKGSIQSKPYRPSLKRYTQPRFATSTDAYITSLNLETPPHSRTILNGLDLPDEIEGLENPIIEPTLEGQISLIGSGQGGIFSKTGGLPYLPRMWDNTSGERSFNIAPRIFFAYGKIKQKNPNLKTALAAPYMGFWWDNPVNIAANEPEITEFGYATQLRTLELDPTPEIDGNVVFGNQVRDLFVMFYLGITQDNRYGNVLDLLMKIEMSDYAKYNFRRLRTFSYNGRPLRIPHTGFRDFAAGSDIPTPATFFDRPAETACCDLPCGCQFTTCEYYQDMGIYMYQSTLNEIRLASFVVDGMELITTPLPLGEIRMVDIGGDPYIMNIVDLLRTIGAPYFTFDISSRISPEKGHRFFSIKRPACTPFKILFTHNGEEAYLYTHTEQKQKWFQSEWGPFGYGDETYEEPINCITETNY